MGGAGGRRFSTQCETHHQRAVTGTHRSSHIERQHSGMPTPAHYYTWVDGSPTNKSHLHHHRPVGEVEELRILPVTSQASSQRSFTCIIRSLDTHRPRCTHHFRDLGPCLFPGADMSRSVCRHHCHNTKG